MATAPKSKEYRDKAVRLRATAQQTKDDEARRDLLRLAADYEQLAASVERRHPQRDDPAD